jgi:hypothetical protein
MISLDFSKEDARKEILQILEENIYVIIKNITSFDLLK